MLYNIYWIPDWPVQRDGQQVEDGGCAAEDVAAGPHVAQERPKYPALPDLQRKICTVHKKYLQCMKNIYSAWKIFLLLQHWYVKCRQMCPQLKLQCFHLRVCKSADQKNNPFPVFPPLISVLQGNLCLVLNLSTKKEQYVIHDVQFQIQIQKINLVDNTAFKQTKMYIYFILVYFLWIKTIYLMLESKYWLSTAENVRSSSLPHLLILFV